MYFIELNEEKLEIAEEVLKSYGVVYSVEKEVEEIGTRRSRQIQKPMGLLDAVYRMFDDAECKTYKIKTDISLEFYDFLKKEIDSKYCNFKFKQSADLANKNALERCYQSKFNGKDVDDKKPVKDKLEKITRNDLAGCMSDWLHCEHKPAKNKPKAWQKTFEIGDKIELPDDVPDVVKQMISDLRDKGQGADIQIIEVRKDFPSDFDF